tara:strand:+ start:382 stop:963 length:582 start_codon:yes stop_codon:yes gene_type:complete
MKAPFVTIFITVLCSAGVMAQEKDKTREEFKERIAFKLEYFGELVLHPGLCIGIDYTISKNNWVTIHWDTDLGGYWHRWNNTSAFLKTSIGSRLAIGSTFADINIGAGYMHSWAAGTIYQRAENGGVEKATNWGHSHFMPTTSLLFGWDGTKKNKLPCTIYLGPEVYLQSSFNHTFLPHLAAKIGFTYKLNKK